MIKNCPMRHENGTCLPAGGFCTANMNICEALHNAYEMGKAQLSQEGTTSDTISRKAAIDLCDWYDNPSMREDLEKLPSAQPERMCYGCRYERHGSVVCDSCSRSFLDRYEVDNNG